VLRFILISFQINRLKQVSTLRMYFPVCVEFLIIMSGIYIFLALRALNYVRKSQMYFVTTIFQR